MELAKSTNRKLVVGCVPGNPSWITFVRPDNWESPGYAYELNQQSSGLQWQTHRQLLSSISPIVDCGVHYVDVMPDDGSCQRAVSGIGARLTDDLPEGKINYGQLQVTFDDGSVGWYEAGWGPMMSENAFFIKM